CEDIEVGANIYRTGEGQMTTTASTTIPIGFSCPAVGGTIGVDIVPPHVGLTSHVDNDTFYLSEGVSLTGDVHDVQTGVASVQIYDGVVRLGEASVTPDPDPIDMSTWSWDSSNLTDLRTYQFTVVATDGAGNQMQTEVALEAL